MRDQPIYVSSLTSVVMMAIFSISTMAYIINLVKQSRELEMEVQKCEKKRQEERKGRIRAEVRLRQAIKSQVANGNDDNGMMLQCIGLVTSPYTKRVGTPRQPQLVPASRGWIDLHPTLQPELLDGIQNYSHVWIIFQFHANTDTASTNKKTKIRPPRAKGVRVGQLATRSPHRPNPMGLSLVAVEKWEKRRLHITGLDLVHGTPVYDIKPFVPWDVPGSKDVQIPTMRVPDWVMEDDAITTVEFTVPSLLQLREAISGGHMKPLYHDSNDGFEGALETLRQILAQDPRSSHRGLTDNARGHSNSDKPYNLVLGNVNVTFTVGNDAVQVICVEPITFDPECYVDGVPLMLTNAREA